MEKFFAELTPIATAVALSPMPIAALLLMLLSKRAKINSIAFLLGWIVGLSFLVIVSSTLISASVGNSSGTHVIKSLINGVLGILLIIFAIKEWNNRANAQMPKWMIAIDSFSPFKAIGVGFLLATLNFKNTPMGIAAAGVMSRASEIFQLELMAYYLLLGSSTIFLPVLVFLLFGKKIQGKLESLKEWLVYHNSAIMFVLFFILGAFLLSKAFGG